MKFFVSLLLLFWGTDGRPSQNYVGTQFHAQGEEGAYNFGYSNPTESKTEIKTADGVVRGNYQYIDANGERQTVHYISDKSGFRVAASNLPISPDDPHETTTSIPKVTPIKAPRFNVEEAKISSHLAKEKKINTASLVSSASAPIYREFSPRSYPEYPLHYDAGHIYVSPTIEHEEKYTEHAQPTADISYPTQPVAETRHEPPIHHGKATQSQFHAQDDSGQYTFGYEDTNSQRTEARYEGVVRGTYNYVDSKGKLQIVHYVADNLGFRVKGTNIPVADQEAVQETPEVQKARKEHMRQFQEWQDKYGLKPSKKRRDVSNVSPITYIPYHQRQLFVPHHLYFNPYYYLPRAHENRPNVLLAHPQPVAPQPLPVPINPVQTSLPVEVPVPEEPKVIVGKPSGELKPEIPSPPIVEEEPVLIVQQPVIVTETKPVIHQEVVHPNKPIINHDVVLPQEVVYEAVLSPEIVHETVVAPAPPPPPAPSKPEIVSPVTSFQFHAQNELGGYNYGYSNPTSSKNEIKTEDGIVRGSYSYIDANGELQTTNYISDALGFRVRSTNLPTDKATDEKVGMKAQIDYAYLPYAVNYGYPSSSTALPLPEIKDIPSVPYTYADKYGNVKEVSYISDVLTLNDAKVPSSRGTPMSTKVQYTYLPYASQHPYYYYLY